MLRWLKFIISHSIFIALCAAALSWQSFIVMDQQVQHGIIWFVFFSTITTYNGYWLLSKYYFAFSESLYNVFKRSRIQLLVFLMALFFSGLFFFQLSTDRYLILMLGIFLTLLYSLPLLPFPVSKRFQRAGFLKPIILALSWATITVLLPLHFTENAWQIGLLFTARFLLILLLSLIFDLRDKEMDEIKGLRTLATDVTYQSLRYIMLAALIGFLLAGFSLRVIDNNKPLMIAFVFTALLVITVYRLSFRKRGYYFYYFLVDGIMLFSPLITYIATIV